MEKSETIAELSKALSKVQSILTGAKMDSDNPFFKSKYADLTSVWEACRKPLTDNGLAVIQTPCTIPDKPEYVVIETILTHSSGEWIKGRLAMKPVKQDPQGIGSCITYARRYSLASLVGICPEDDDGNAASGKGKSEEKTLEANKAEPEVRPMDKQTNAKPKQNKTAIYCPKNNNKPQPKTACENCMEKGECFE
jgi:hypothetical protein